MECGGGWEEYVSWNGGKNDVLGGMLRKNGMGQHWTGACGIREYIRWTRGVMRHNGGGLFSLKTMIMNMVHDFTDNFLVHNRLQ